MTTASDGPSETVDDTEPLIDLLGHVADLTARSISGVDGVGVSVFASDAAAHVLSTAADTVGVGELDSIQSADLGEGPTVTASQLRAAVVAGDLAADVRWPRFGVLAADRGVRSVLVAPLIVDEVAVGTLACWSRTQDAFDVQAQRDVTAFAAWAAASVRNVRVLERARTQAQQLQSALVSRATIDQAIGILRSRTGGTADEAFLSLRDISQRENVKLAVIAERLVDEAVRRARARHASG